MGFQDYVSETEAATLSGVSISTLRRFSEVGYLKVERDADGVPLFSKSELAAVFGGQSYSVSSSSASPSKGSPFSGASSTKSASNGATSSTTTGVTSAGTTPTTPKIASLFDLIGKTSQSTGSSKETAPSKDTASSEAASQSESASLSQPLSTAVETSPLASSPLGEEMSTLAAATSPAVDTSTQTSSLNSYAESVSIPAEVVAVPVTLQAVAPLAAALPASPLGSTAEQDLAAITARASHLSLALEELSNENRKLRNVLDLQEKILTIRENEIRDLKDQRDWLKSRLERLEEKADRDQLLLLSETQTIRRLIALQEPKKSSIRLALEWLGLGPTNQEASTNNEGSDTIEIRPGHSAKATENARPTPSSNKPDGTKRAA